jgi:hypothetical protein
MHGSTTNAGEFRTLGSGFRLTENIMADDTSVRTGIDRNRINTSQDHEVRYWTKELGVSAEQLQAAVQAVGSSADKVREYLSGRRK